jgi:IS30 family transposase
VDFLRRYSKPHSANGPLEKANAHLQTVRRVAESGPLRPRRRAHKLAQRLSSEERERVVCGYESGLSATRTGEELGLTEKAVLTVLRQQGVERRVQELTAEEIQTAVALYATGLSLLKIAKQLGRAHSSIQRVLVGADVALRPMGKPCKLTAEQVAQAAVDYQAGESTVVIGKRLGVGSETVRRALLRAGVALRPRTRPAP